MTELQYQYDGVRGAEFYTKQQVVHLTESLDRDFTLAAARSGLKKSTILRLFIMKFCDKINPYPKELRQEASKEISDTVNNMMDILPATRRQLQAEPRL